MKILIKEKSEKIEKKQLKIKERLKQYYTYLQLNLNFK